MPRRSRLLRRTLTAGRSHPRVRRARAARPRPAKREAAAAAAAAERIAASAATALRPGKYGRLLTGSSIRRWFARATA